MLEQVEQNLGAKPQAVSADSGYWDPKQVERIQVHKFKGLICTWPRGSRSMGNRVNRRWRHKQTTEQQRNYWIIRKQSRRSDQHNDCVRLNRVPGSRGHPRFHSRSKRTAGARPQLLDVWSRAMHWEPARAPGSALVKEYPSKVPAELSGSAFSLLYDNRTSLRHGAAGMPIQTGSCRDAASAQPTPEHMPAGHATIA
jgi:hypothetical protein